MACAKDLSLCAWGTRFPSSELSQPDGVDVLPVPVSRVSIFRTIQAELEFFENDTVSSE